MKSSWSVCEFVRWGKIRHMRRDERKAILGAGCLLGPAIINNFVMMVLQIHFMEKRKIIPKR